LPQPLTEYVAKSLKQKYLHLLHLQRNHWKPEENTNI